MYDEAKDACIYKGDFTREKREKTGKMVNSPHDQ